MKRSYVAVAAVLIGGVRHRLVLGRRPAARLSHAVVHGEDHQEFGRGTARRSSRRTTPSSSRRSCCPTTSGSAAAGGLHRHGGQRQRVPRHAVSQGRQDLHPRRDDLQQQDDARHRRRDGPVHRIARHADDDEAQERRSAQGQAASVAGLRMARRRDMRRFGARPYQLGQRRSARPRGTGYPSHPTSRPSRRSRSCSVSASCRRCRATTRRPLEPVLGVRKPSDGYFLRAESFFDVAQFVDGGSEFTPDLSRYGDVPLHEQSHGESLLALAYNRFGGHCLYVLDEPEAALSVTGAPAAGDRRASGPRRRAVHRRDPLAGPARDPGRADLRADGQGRRGERPRRPRRGALHARLPRGPERYLRAALGDD